MKVLTLEASGFQIHRKESPYTGQGQENKNPRMTSVQINPGTRRGTRDDGQETMKLTTRQDEENFEGLGPHVCLVQQL